MQIIQDVTDEEFKSNIKARNNCLKKQCMTIKNLLKIIFITERYDYVGKLLKPGEAPTNYSDEEDEGSQQETEIKSENYETDTKTDCNETMNKSKSD